MARTPKARRDGERGVVVLYVALFLLVSLWFVSLAIDVGKVMAARTQLQAAADAAALAGASALDPETGFVIQDSARVRAALTAQRNLAYEGVPTPVTINPITDVDFPEPDRVRVTARRTQATGNPVLLHFAQTIGLRSLSVTADATAEAKVLESICEGLAPFGPEKPEDSDDDDEEQTYSSDCGTVYPLKLSAQTGENGNFQLLSFPPCNEDDEQGGGADAVHYRTLNGYGCCAQIGETVETEPGNKVGPMRDALQERWDRDNDQTSTCYQNYRGNGSRVFITPIVESFDVNGRKVVRIDGFAAFFMVERPLDKMSQYVVQGQYIKVVAPGTVGQGPPPPNSGVFGVHLVE